MKANKNWSALLSTFLQPHSDKENAQKMKDYMRGQFEYFGIKAPLRSSLQKEFLAKNPFPIEDRHHIIKELWQFPEREIQYIAMDLHFRSRKAFSPEDLSLIEYCITEKSWWDTVDFIAAKTLGEYLKQYPEAIKEVCDRWMDSGNIWLQRSCLLFQLKYKQKTDIDLLFRLIRELMHEKEFFIRKAIGWVLREYSKTDAKAVQEFVSKEPLQPLSSKEALGWLRKRQGNDKILNHQA